MTRKLLEAGTQSTENKDHIIQLYQSGKNIVEIIQLYPKISINTLIRYLIKWGIPIRNYRYYREHTEKTMENDKQKIIKQYKEGLTAPEIAEQYPRSSKETVLKYLKKWGTPMKTTKGIRRRTEQNHKTEIIDLYKSGKTIRQIAALYPDIAQSTMHHYLSQWKVDMRTATDYNRI